MDTNNPFKSSESYTINEVCHILKISRKTFERRERDGGLPRAVRFKGIGPRVSGDALHRWWKTHADPVKSPGESEGDAKED